MVAPTLQSDHRFYRHQLLYIAFLQSVCIGGQQSAYDPRVSGFCVLGIISQKLSFWSIDFEEPNVTGPKRSNWQDVTRQTFLIEDT